MAEMMEFATALRAYTPSGWTTRPRRLAPGAFAPSPCSNPPVYQKTRRMGKNPSGGFGGAYGALIELVITF